ncbi:MAG: OmpA family protein [Defluviicoccus sp.]|nr:OmpA family protein [Defluviicoccus sp.]
MTGGQRRRAKETAATIVRRVARVAAVGLAAAVCGAPVLVSAPLDRAELTTRLVPVTGDESPSVDLSVPFAKNSANLAQAARGQLDELAAALAGEKLRGFEVGVYGHTDASGPAAYNLKLSRARAAAVVGYLVDRHRLDGARFRHEGFGEERLLSGIDPNSPRHRRVEIEILSGRLGSSPDAETAPARPGEAGTKDRDDETEDSGSGGLQAIQ